MSIVLLVLATPARAAGDNAVESADSMYKACVRVWAATYAPTKEVVSDILDVSVERCRNEEHDLVKALFVQFRGNKADPMVAAREWMSETEKRARKEALRVIFETRYPDLKCCLSHPSLSR